MMGAAHCVNITLLCTILWLGVLSMVVGIETGNPAEIKSNAGHTLDWSKTLDIIELLRERDGMSQIEGQRPRPPFGLLQEAVAAHAAALEPLLTRLLRTAGHPDPPAQAAAALHAATAPRVDLPDIICTACKALLRPLTLSPFPPWEEARPLWLQGCFTITDTDATLPLCEGLIELIGYHIFHILQQEKVTPQAACELLNVCWPPDTRDMSGTPAVGRGTPPRGRPARGRKESERSLEGAIRLAQITDIHINTAYSVGSPTNCGLPVCCSVTNEGTGSAGEYGDYSCNPPPVTIDLVLDGVAAFNPDLVVYTGDSPPHTMWEETLTSQLNCSAITAASLAAKLPNNTILPCIGNHDTYPTGLLSRVDIGTGISNLTESLLEHLTAIWSPLAEFGVEQTATMLDGGYYSTPTQYPNLTVLAFNTDTEMYSYNFYSVLNHDEGVTLRMRQHAEQTLQTARDNGEKVIVLFHHPVGHVDAIVSVTRWWEEIVSRYSDVIVLQMAGHTHLDHFRSFRAGESVTGTMFVSPSVSPTGNRDPSVRLYYLHPTDYTLLDYEQYRFDLKEPTKALQFNYRATEEYALADMSPEAWLDLAYRMHDDDEMFSRYYIHQKSDSHSRNCVDECRVYELCSMQFANLDEISYCTLENLQLPTLRPTQPPSSSPPTPSSTTTHEQTSSPSSPTSLLTSTTTIPQISGASTIFLNFTTALSMSLFVVYLCDFGSV